MFSPRNLLFTLAILFITYETSLAQMGRSCTPDSCTGGMICTSGKCECPRDTITDDDQTKCLPVATVVGSGCDVEAQCTKILSDYAHCVDHKCVCKENAMVVNSNKCVRRPELDEQCSTDEWCRHIANAACISKVCACNDRNVPHSTNRTLCLPIAITFQSTCEENLQCSKELGDQAFCHESKKCRCQEGHHIITAYNQKCLPNKGLQETCEVGECYLPLDGENQNIACVSGTCACKDDLTPSRDNQSCSGSSGLKNLGPLTALWLVALAMSRNLF